MSSSPAKFTANTSQKTDYDCIIPLSGGTESTAVLYDCLKRGLNPLCFHVELGTHWQQQLQGAENITQALGVELRIVEYFNAEPYSNKQAMADHWNALWGASVPPMFFIWTNIAQLVNLSNPHIRKIYYGYNGGIHTADDGLGDKHTDWVDDHFRSIERVLGKLEIHTTMSAPLAHMAKLEQWNSLPEHIQKLVHTCVHPAHDHCGDCTKCREFDYMLRGNPQNSR